MKKIYISLALLALFACSSERVLVGLENTINLESKEIKLSPPYLGKGYQFSVYHHYLIILDYADERELFKIYDLNTKKKYFSFGEKGTGPEQIISPGSFIIDESIGQLYIADNGRQNIASYDMEEILKNRIAIKSILSQPHEVQLTFFYTLSDSTFITRQLDQTDDLLLSFRNKELLDTIGKVLKNDDPLVLGDRFNQYYYIFNKHPSRELYVSSYFNYDVLQITDANTNTSLFFQGPDGISYKDRKKDFAAYRWVEIGEERIYASYIGRELSHSDQTSPYPQEIHVLNLKGEAIANLKLDIPIQYFTVDEKNHLIYALSDTEEGDFVTFELPEL